MVGAFRIMGSLLLFGIFWLDNTRWGWCPRTGKGQRLMIKEAVTEYMAGNMPK